MSITLDSLELPSGLMWADEFADDSVMQAVRRRLNGALSIYPRGNVAGRPITLQAPADHWLTRAQAEALAAMAVVPGATYTLTFGDRAGSPSFSVVFRHNDPPALELAPMIGYADPADDDPIVGTIKFLTV